jgi:hypothetical protein
MARLETQSLLIVAFHTGQIYNELAMVFVAFSVEQ